MSGTINNDMLISQITEGSIQAFDEFYRRYYSFVMQIAQAMLHDHMEAEEVCHDVFLDIIRKAHLYTSSRGSIEAWIAIMTKSKCKDLLRKKQRRNTIFANYQTTWFDETDNVTENISLQNLQYAQLHDAVKQLPNQQQRAVIATYIEQKTQQECAKLWQVPLGTVKSWVRYGMQNLKKQLKQAE